MLALVAACSQERDVRIVDASGHRPGDLRVWLDADGDIVTIDCASKVRPADVICTDHGVLLDRKVDTLGVVAKSILRHTERVAPQADTPDIYLTDLPAPEVTEAYATSFFGRSTWDTELPKLAYDAPSSFGKTLVVKFYIDDIQGTPKVYFQNTNQYRTHFDFAHGYLGKPVTIPEFEAATYHGPDRTAMAGSMIFYADLPGSDKTPDSPITIELAPADDATPEQALDAYLLLEERMTFLPHTPAPNALLYVPAGSTQEEQLGNGHVFDAAGALHVAHEDLYAGVSMQLLNPGVAYGTLRALTPDQLQTTIVSFHDIIVLDRLPNQIPLVGGTITGELQTPLAHVNIVAHTRGSPNLALIGALQDPRVAPFVGHLVRFEVTGDGFEIRDTTLAEAQAFWDSRTNRPHITPAADVTRSGLLDFANVGFADAIAIGVKAANVAEMTHFIPTYTPKGFAVPFYYYEQFMTTTTVASGMCAGAEVDCTTEGRTAQICAAARALCTPSETAGDTLDTYLTKMFADTTFQTDAEVREASLNSLRYIMRNTPIDPTLAAALDAKTNALFGAGPFRMRSSTNAEDLPNFSGAGLYDSYTAYSSGTKAASLVIRKTWASVWNWRAVEERAFWNIDQRATRMGVAVETSFPVEQCNGVLVTQNISGTGNPGFAGMYVNAQAGEVPVTNPEGGALPEIFLILDGPSGLQIARERYSSLSPGVPLMSDAEIVQMANVAAQVQNHFAPLYNANVDTYPLDIEWKYEGPERALYFKQVRPYTQTQ